MTILHCKIVLFLANGWHQVLENKGSAGLGENGANNVRWADKRGQFWTMHGVPGGTLESAGTIFREILPEAFSAGQVDAAVATLLFDLMQQADQLLLQFDTALEPLHALIEHFALMFLR